MIFGDCPYCDKTIANTMPRKTPVVFEARCQHCGKTYWVYAARSKDCMAYTQEDFKKEFEIDVVHQTFKMAEPA